MMKWLNTIRWKNLLIIWISIIVIIVPHFKLKDWIQYIEFIRWAIICTSIAAIGNITNDLWDIKQDKENKKKNIFIEGRNKRMAYFIMAVFLLINLWTCLSSRYFNYFLFISLVSLALLVLYNLFLKKIALLGNLIIATLTAFIFLGIDLIISTRIFYFNTGFTHKSIELLACFAFITTFIREILKDAEDRKGDSFAGFKTIARYLKDKWLALLIFLISILGCLATYYIIGTRHTHFIQFYFYFSGWILFISMVSAIVMIVPHPSRYVRATRIVKAGMIGCLIIYLALSIMNPVFIFENELSI
jgi:4-hydroxybenzoate polyprenyltransferase